MSDKEATPHSMDPEEAGFAYPGGVTAVGGGGIQEPGGC